MQLKLKAVVTSFSQDFSSIKRCTEKITFLKSLVKMFHDQVGSALTVSSVYGTLLF